MKVTITGGDAKVFIQMSHAEALRTIESLVLQIRTNDPNTGRYEALAEDGVYFTIAVMPFVHQEESLASKVAYMSRGELEKLVDAVNHEIKLDDLAKEESLDGNS